MFVPKSELPVKRVSVIHCSLFEHLSFIASNSAVDTLDLIMSVNVGVNAVA